MKPVIEIRNVSKKYVFGLRKTSNLLQDKIVGLIKRPSKVLPIHKKINGLKDNEFWALKNISFNVMRGEVIGIIGKNGAGKSTLLKILSQITLPTEGEVILRGRVASLLEVGTGFHPELTGRENIYLNGAILGMKRVEIKKKFDQIVQFAEIEKFLDTPVKHYSSGMYMRLAFAVAAHLEPEILLVDEVLAVGDAEFQKKCLGKMKNVAGSGTTVLFVSHNMETVENLCTKCLLIQKGTIITSGNVEDVVRTYLEKDSKNTIGRLKSGPITLTLKTLTPRGECRNTFQVGKGVLIKAIINSEIPLAHADFGVGIEDSLGIRICTFHTQYQRKDKFSFKKKCQLIINWKEIIILPGLYKFVAAIYEKGELIAHWENLDQFNIVAADYYKTGKLPNPSHQGKILVKSAWSIIKD